MSALPERILIVDDEEDIRLTIQRTLSANERAFVQAENGEEALAAINARNPHYFSCVILDIMMPVMDGLDTLASIRGNQRTARLPVIVLTALEDKEIEALTLGANDYIRKPFDPGALRLRVENTLTTAVAERLMLAQGFELPV